MILVLVCHPSGGGVDEDVIPAEESKGVSVLGNRTLWGSIGGRAVSSISSVFLSELGGGFKCASLRDVLKSTIDDCIVANPDTSVLESLIVAVGLMFEVLAAGMLVSVSFMFVFMFCKYIEGGSRWCY